MLKTPKKIALALLLLSLPVAARAACTLDARMTDAGLVVTWDTGERAAASSTLTLYRDGWPVLAVCATGRSGSYTFPSGYTSMQGAYKVRLRCQSGCVTAPVRQDPTPQPQDPTASPTEKPAPVPTAKPTPAATPVPNASSLAEQMIALINADRAAAGLGAVAYDAALTRAACVRAGEIVTRFSHTRPDSSSWSTVYSGAFAENIAKGYATAEKCEAAFMSSQGHRENILRGSYTKVGVCAFVSGGVTYWVQLFGR